MTCFRDQIIFLLMCVVLPSMVHASEMPTSGRLEPRKFPQENVESFIIYSAKMARSYDVSVALPSDYKDKPTQEYPALLVTDGNRMFPSAKATVEALEGQIDPLIVLSVGAPFEEGEETYTFRRVQEFSPKGWQLSNPFGQAIAETCKTKYQRSPNECVGRAPEFLEFITFELLPALYEKFRIKTDDLGLFGLSAGGYFTSWVMFQDVSPFRKYIISSPAMAYGNGNIFTIEEAYAREHDDLEAIVYMASGSMELDDPELEGRAHIVSGQARFGAALKSRHYPSLFIVSEMHAGLGHVDVAPVTLARGLRTLFGASK